MSFKNLALRAKIMLGSITPLVLVVILSVITFFSIKTLQKAGDSVDHTHVVIEEAMKIEGAAVDMETGMRGFLLAGREEFLDPYNQGKEQFFVKLGRLKDTVNDNPKQVKLLEEIEDNIRG